MFTREGAKVVIGDVLEEEGRRTEAALNEAGGECVFVRLDVTSEDDWAEAVGTAIARFGKLDILVNNAGISITGGIEDFTVEDWQRTFDINAKGVFLVLQRRVTEECLPVPGRWRRGAFRVSAWLVRCILGCASAMPAVPGVRTVPGAASHALPGTPAGG